MSTPEVKPSIWNQTPSPGFYTVVMVLIAGTNLQDGIRRTREGQSFGTTNAVIVMLTCAIVAFDLVRWIRRYRDRKQRAER
jgi:uncharacterized membrane-anchored protein